MMVKALQIRAARAILSWSQQQLAERAKLNRDTIKALETDGVRTHPGTVQAVLNVLQTEGISFLEDDVSLMISVQKSDADAA